MSRSSRRPHGGSPAPARGSFDPSAAVVAADDVGPSASSGGVEAGRSTFRRRTLPTKVPAGSFVCPVTGRNLGEDDETVGPPPPAIRRPAARGRRNERYGEAGRHDETRRSHVHEGSGPPRA